MTDADRRELLRGLHSTLCLIEDTARIASILVWRALLCTGAPPIGDTHRLRVELRDLIAATTSARIMAINLGLIEVSCEGEAPAHDSEGSPAV